MKTAALYICGRLVVAKSHLEAYQQLSEAEKESQMISGFYDSETGEFCADKLKDHFYRKKMLLMRHGQSQQNSIDPDLTAQGVEETEEVTKYLGQFDLSGFKAYVSPLLRCLKTANIIQSNINIDFEVKEDIIETPTFLKEGESVHIQNRQNEFPQFQWKTDQDFCLHHEEECDFIERISQVLKLLPQKSILVSHFGVVTNIAKLALCGEKCQETGIPTASLTYINDQKVMCYGKVIE